MAWTSPAFTFKSMPFRIAFSWTRACKFRISSIRLVPRSAYTAFQTHTQQTLRLHREFHRAISWNTSLQKPFTIMETASSLVMAALPAVEDLVLAMRETEASVLHLRGGILHLEIRKGVRAALAAQQHGVALRIVARALRPRQDLHHAAVAVLAVAGGNALGNDGRARVLAMWIILVPVSACW